MKSSILNPGKSPEETHIVFNDKSYYSHLGRNTHFINLQFSTNESYYIVYWESAKKASITHAFDDDTFDDDTREVFKLFNMYYNEEDHFMDSTVKNIEVPYEVMAELPKLTKVLQELYDELL